VIIPQLDIRTLSLVTVFFALMHGVGLVMFAISQRSFKGFMTLGASMLCLAAGFLFMAYRGFLPDFFSIVLANVLIVSSFSFVHEGITRFLKSRRSFITISRLIPVITFGSFLYYTYVDPSLGARIVLVNVFIIILTVFCVRSLQEKMTQGIRIPLTMTIMVFFLNGGFSLIRIFWTLVDDPGDRFMSAGLVHSLAFLVMQIYILGSAFGYVWIDSKFLEIDLRRQARVDPLTGALNRRALESEIEVEIARVNRGAAPFSIIMFDLDHFKRLNDSYGHKVGDIALIMVTDYVRSALRQQDTIARYGGEEFLISLPETPKTIALEVARRLRMGMEKIRIPTLRSGDISITASFGVGTYREDADDWQSLVEMTDQALYTAKRNGRNRVEAANVAAAGSLS